VKLGSDGAAGSVVDIKQRLAKEDDGSAR